MFKAQAVSNQRSRSFLLVGITMLAALIFTQCETYRSIRQRRIKSIEKGLLKAVVFKGQKPERMKLSERMQYYQVPAVSMAVIDKFQLDWAKAYGLKDIESQDPVTVDTFFQAASLSQSASALGSLYLAQEGSLQLDEDINKKLRAWKIPAAKPMERKKISLRQLLTHTAGLAEVEYSGYTSSQEFPSLKQILRGEKPAKTPQPWVALAPGSEIRYSEAGFVILQQLIEDMEKRPFSQFMKEAIFKPLQMNNSGFWCPLPPDLHERAAAGHFRQGKPINGKYCLYPELAAAGLWTTASDLARLAVEIMGSAMGHSSKLISTQLAREMLTAQVGNQGLGFKVDGEGDSLHFYQSGHNAGFECFLIAYPVRGQGAVIMTNSDNGSYLIDEILRAISDAYDWPHFKPEVKPLYRLQPSLYDQYVGRYQVSSDYYLDITHQDYNLIVEPTDQLPTKFYVESQTIFFSTDPYIQIQFVRDNQGKITGLILRQKRIRMEARKVD